MNGWKPEVRSAKVNEHFFVSFVTFCFKSRLGTEAREGHEGSFH
jgi:hypothetical protein